MTVSRRALALLILLAAAPRTATSATGEPVLVRALDPSVPATRTWFVGESASTEDAVDLRLRLVDAGARNVNLFLPDRVIVCDLPDRLESPVDLPAGFIRAGNVDVEAQPAMMFRSWSWIIGAYEAAGAAGARPASADFGVDMPFDDVVIRTPVAELDRVQREADKLRLLRASSPAAVVEQNVAQSSSFLGGSVTANFLFAESDGSYEPNLESWSDEDLATARQGAVQAMIEWQGAFPKMDLGFVFNFEERVATSYEPITHSMRNDSVWMLDVLRTLGFAHGTDVLAAVHDYNQARRALHRTQWVFSAFIACSRNTPNNKFDNGAADYTAYAFLGGPCMIEPFPAGTDINGVGEQLVFSQIVNHEVGHCFWTLDEYPGAPGSCSSASGYLNYGNGNISSLAPGGTEVRCNPMQECIMHSAARKSIYPRPWCGWSRGHLGVVDGNGNGYPDILEARPRIEFLSAEIETVLTNEYTLRFRAVATAVKNRNPNLAPEKRVDYPVPIKRAWVTLGGNSFIELTPLDGNWGGAVEEFEFRMDLAQVGLTAVSVEAFNSAGYTSGRVGKKVYFIGVDFTRAGVTAKQNRNRVTWEIAGNPFNAKFDVYRLDPGEAMPGARIQSDVKPGSNTAGFISYLYDDHDIVPGRDYRYYVQGNFSLLYEDSLRYYQAKSRTITQTAMIPIAGDVISSVAPNPSRGNVTFSVSVPRTYGGTEIAPLRLATPVDIAIYNVRGQMVRAIARGESLDDVMTLHWDGNDTGHRPVPSGIYFVRARAGSSTGQQKIVLIR